LNKSNLSQKGAKSKTKKKTQESGKKTANSLRDKHYERVRDLFIHGEEQSEGNHTFPTLVSIADRFKIPHHLAYRWSSDGGWTDERKAFTTKLREQMEEVFLEKMTDGGRLLFENLLSLGSQIIKLSNDKFLNYIRQLELHQSNPDKYPLPEFSTREIHELSSSLQKLSTTFDKYVPQPVQKSSEVSGSMNMLEFLDLARENNGKEWSTIGD
jgi:hypothetical protein